MTHTYSRIGLAIVTTLFTVACAQDLPSSVLNNNASQSSLAKTPTNVTQVPGDTTVVTPTPITVVANNLSLTPSSMSPAANSTLTLSASGGTAPYVYSASTSNGMLSGSTFFTSVLSETVTFSVTDSAGHIATTTVTTQAVASKVIYQFSANALHYYSDSTSDSDGMSRDGVAYKLLQNSGNNISALYRCYTSDFHYFDSTDGGCEGFNMSATLGYLFTTPVPGTTALYRYSASNLDHIDSTNSSVGGYSREGIIGYVPLQ